MTLVGLWLRYKKCEVAEEEREEIFSYSDSSSAASMKTVPNVLIQLKRFKKNRSPGVDGFSIEHLPRER